MRPKYNTDDEQFFYRDRTPVTMHAIWKVLKLMIKQCKIDERNYCFHGLRAGRTCNLLRLGLSVETIKDIGRWKSNTVFAYLK